MAPTSSIPFQQHAITLLGPNCLGFLRPALGLNASFAKRMPQNGKMAFFSQSGALCTALLDLTEGTLGFSHFASIGNKAVIDENVLLQHFAQDENVKTIAFYTEGLSASKDIVDTGRAILSRSEAKPVIALKSGTTAAGSHASSSHTGALAGSDAAYDGLLRQARIVRAKTLEELLDMLDVFSHNPLPGGNRLAIVTNAGGLGVLATDAAVQNGLEIASLSPETTEKLKTVLPPAGSANNPVDVLGDALSDRYRASIDAVAADSRVDMVLVIVTPQTMTEAKATAEAIVDAKKRSGKPVAAVFAGHASLMDGLATLKKNDVSAFAYPETAVAALAGLSTVSRWRAQTVATAFTLENIDREKAAAVISTAKNEGRETLSETEAAAVLMAYGFPFLRTTVVRNKKEAEKAALAVGQPVALKIVSPDIIHKSDAHGVLLGIDPSEAASAYETLMKNIAARVPTARLEGALVVEMAQTGGTEIILGLKKEPGLGTVVLAGLGGIFTEIFKDSALRFSPLTEEDAREMLGELKGYALLTGARGQKGADIAALVGMIGRLSRLAEDFPDIAELDINPFIISEIGTEAYVADARMTLRVEGVV
jgi:acetyltransferase